MCHHFLWVCALLVQIVTAPPLFGSTIRLINSLVSLYEEGTHSLAFHLAVFAQQRVPAPPAFRLWQLWGVAVGQDPPYVVGAMQAQDLR
jgi:hypothetical protein